VGRSYSLTLPSPARGEGFQTPPPLMEGEGGIGVKIGLAPGTGHSSSLFPLPPGERVSRTPSLDGRGKGEGDKALLSQRPIPYLNAYGGRGRVING